MLNDTNYENRIKKGMVVYSAEGEKLGKVSELTGETFVVEKGFFFPEERVFRMRDVLSLNDDEITISASRDSLSSVDADSLRAGAAYRSDDERSVLSSRTDMTHSEDITDRSVGFGAKSGFRDDDRILETGSKELSVPLVEEEIVVDKNMHEVGQVRIHKEVHTETRHIEVPVTREEIVIERVATNRSPDADDASLFTDKDIVVPVRVEEVEISKRPVVREEVRIKKEAVSEEKHMDAQVRKETVRIDEDGSVNKLPNLQPKRGPMPENRPTP